MDGLFGRPADSATQTGVARPQPRVMWFEAFLVIGSRQCLKNIIL